VTVARKRGEVACYLPCFLPDVVCGDCESRWSRDGDLVGERLTRS